MIINPINCIAGNTAKALHPSDKTIFKINLSGKRIGGFFNTGVGDVFFALPLFKYLKEKDPTIKIELALKNKMLLLLSDVPYLKRVYPIQQHEIRQDYMDYMYNFGLAITQNLDAERLPAVKAYFKYIDKNFDFSDIPDSVLRPEIPIREKALSWARMYAARNRLLDKPLVALQLKSSSIIRAWVYQYNIELSKKLVALGCNVLLLDSDDTWKFEMPGVTFLQNEKGKPADLSQVYAVLSLCDLIIAPDSCIIQFALALNKPVIGIYGAFPSEYRTMNLDKTYGIDPVWGIEKLSCKGPCFQHRKDCPLKQIPSPCMASITPERVFEVAKGIIDLVPRKIRKINIDEKGFENTCTFCGSKEAHLLSEWGDHYDGRSCSECNSIYNPNIKPGSLVSIYQEPNYFEKRYMNTGYKKDCRYVFDSLLQRLKPTVNTRLKRDMVIADIGCGIGTLAAMLRTLPGAIVYGVDISTHAKLLAMKMNALTITNRNFLTENIFESGVLDLIVFSHYLEHGGGEDWIINLQKAFTYLKKDGMIYIYGPSADKFYEKVPNLHPTQKWFHLSGGDHIDIPSKKGLEMILKKVGFENILVRDRGGDDLDAFATKPSI